MEYYVLAASVLPAWFFFLLLLRNYYYSPFYLIELKQPQQQQHQQKLSDKIFEKESQQTRYSRGTGDWCSARDIWRPVTITGDTHTLKIGGWRWLA